MHPAFLFWEACRNEGPVSPAGAGHPSQAHCDSEAPFPLHTLHSGHGEGQGLRTTVGKISVLVLFKAKVSGRSPLNQRRGCLPWEDAAERTGVQPTSLPHVRPLP